jgi:hypothetical protein
MLNDLGRQPSSFVGVQTSSFLQSRLRGIRTYRVVVNNWPDHFLAGSLQQHIHQETHPPNPEEGLGKVLGNPHASVIHTYSINSSNPFAKPGLFVML